ncbi:MAG: hypothetical protein Roseis2KO_11650 [Roseivirga sp.]
MSKLLSKLDLQGYITLSYLGAVAVGMMFDYQYYNHFAIDIFEYSDILDFLLTPARNLEVILFVLATIVIVWVLFRIDKAWEDKYPKSYRRFNFPGWQKSLKKYRSGLFIFSLVLYLFIASTVYGERKFEQFNTEPTPVSLTFESGSKTISGSLIGKNKDYLFLQAPDSTIKAIPINADVQEIVIARSGE